MVRKDAASSHDCTTLLLLPHAPARKPLPPGAAAPPPLLCSVTLPEAEAQNTVRGPLRCGRRGMGAGGRAGGRVGK